MSTQNEENLKSRIDYFENEKGDCTITLDDEPIAICENTETANKLVGFCRANEIIVKAQNKFIFSRQEAEELVKKEMPFMWDERYGFDKYAARFIELFSRVGV